MSDMNIMNNKIENLTINVKIFKMGSNGVVEVDLEKDGATVETALKAANIDLDKNDEVRISGKAADSTSKVKDGDVIIAAKPLEGGC